MRIAECGIRIFFNLKPEILKLLSARKVEMGRG
jgi:hypothetical protein